MSSFFADEPLQTLEGRQIVLGVTGGIAAYKAGYIARELLARGAQVRVVMTPNAARFVGPVTFTGLVGTPPIVDIWDPTYPGEIHIELADWAHAMVIAPATANSIARLAHGFAEDAVSTTALAFDGPTLIAPAMHHRMWSHAATQTNVGTLRTRGVHFVGPAFGKLASGAEGLGRMAEPLEIADAVQNLFLRDLEGLRLLISAGPTHEPIDPVRFLGNRSSGKMGYAIATNAALRGAHVTLISGPVALTAPKSVEVVRVTRALEMQAAIESRFASADAIVMAAAVADFRPATLATEKIKKVDGADAPTLALVRNPDILAGLGARRVGKHPMLVGFAVESRDVAEFARQKLVKKQVDLVVGNPADVAFEGDENEAWLVDAEQTVATGRITKRALAERIVDVIRDHSRTSA